eukprot:284782-Prorocentrum_minimum.AAC.1
MFCFSLISRPACAPPHLLSAAVAAAGALPRARRVAADGERRVGREHAHLRGGQLPPAKAGELDAHPPPFCLRDPSQGNARIRFIRLI